MLLNDGMEEDTHDDLDTWQTVGAVTAKLLLRLKQVNFHAVDDEKLIQNQPRDDELVEDHARTFDGLSI